MIKSLLISGFKSFASQEIPFSAVTLLCGLNNSGKSTVLQALRMYCNSANGLDPVLPSHGSIDELRSNFVHPSSPIEFKSTFSDGSTDSLVLTSESYNRSKKAPLSMFLSAERFGPRVTLPLAEGYKRYPVIGEYGEHVVDFLESLRDCLVPDILHHNNAQGQTLEFEVAAWLSEIAPGTDFKFSVDKKTDSSNFKFNSYRATNAGFGLSYSLPIISAILGASTRQSTDEDSPGWRRDWARAQNERGVLLIIENPEAHLHPSAQTAVGRLIAKGGFAGLQIVVETQSEHIMDGVRLEAKERQVEADLVAFNYLSRSSDGFSILDTPKLTSNGKLSHWPAGFFDQALKNKIQLAK